MGDALIVPEICWFEERWIGVEQFKGRKLPVDNFGGVTRWLPGQLKMENEPM